MSQYEALKDGTITEAEYRQAYLDGVDCMRRGGLSVKDVALTPTEFGVRVSWMAGPGPGQSETDAEALSTACEDEFDTYVGIGWDTQYQDIYLPEYRAVLVECLKGHGIDASAAHTAAEFREIVPGDPMTSPLTSCQGTATEKVLATRAPEPLIPSSTPAL
jgi:hypothetical protein